MRLTASCFGCDQPFAAIDNMYCWAGQGYLVVPRCRPSYAVSSVGATLGMEAVKNEKGA